MALPFTHPLTGANAGTLLRLLAHNGMPAPNRMLTLAAIASVVAARVPFTLLERAVAAVKLRSVGDMPPPIFIVGHWRSGTTHLGNLFAASNQFGYVSPIAAGLPWELLTLGRWLGPFLERTIPEDRLIDRVPVTPKSPQEDMYPLANMQTVSYLHALYFPRHFERNLDRGIFMDGCTPEEIGLWENAHVCYMKKLYLYCGQRPLLIRNPVYTVRMRRLAGLWPDARFIHIHRDPCRVFVSMRNFYHKLLPALALQRFDHIKLDEIILTRYRRMLDVAKEGAAALPDNRYIEIAYEHLDESPLQLLERIYGRLELDGLEEARPRFEAYLDRIGTFEKNVFEMNSDVMDLVEQHLGPYLSQWRYDFRGGSHS